MKIMIFDCVLVIIILIHREESASHPSPYAMRRAPGILAIAITDFPGQPKHVRDGNSERRTQNSAVDISRAYFNAATNDDNPTYVMLPPEDPDHGVKCGLLKKHMYGTREAVRMATRVLGVLEDHWFHSGRCVPVLVRQLSPTALHQCAWR